MYDQKLATSTWETVKNMLISPLFLVGAISYSVYGFFEFLGSIVGGSIFEKYLSELMGMGSIYGADYAQLQLIFNAYHGAKVMFGLILSLPVLLIIAGIWMLFISARKYPQSQIKVTGLAMIHVIATIQLVLACIGIALVEILCVFALAGIGAVSDYGSGGAYVGGVMIFLMILIAAVALVRILYYIKLRNNITVMKHTLVSGIPDAGLSKYVEIFCYIAGGCAVFQALLSMVSGNLYAFFANAGIATAHITFGIYQNQYSKNMKNAANIKNQNTGLQKDPSSLSDPHPAPAESGAVEQGMVRQMAENQVFETTQLQYQSDTTVLGAPFMNQGQVQPVRLSRQKTGEIICVSKPMFWIGKDVGNVDYCITDNSAISRKHLLITIRSGKCYIRDNHSTNKVFLNGQVISTDVDIPVSEGDRVRLGDEEFVVHTA